MEHEADNWRWPQIFLKFQYLKVIEINKSQFFKRFKWHRPEQLVHFILDFCVPLIKNK